MVGNESFSFGDKINYKQVLFELVQACNKLYIMSSFGEYKRAVDCLEATIPQHLDDKKYKADLESLGKEINLRVVDAPIKDRELLGSHQVSKEILFYFKKFSLLLDLLLRLGLLTFSMVDEDGDNEL